MFGLTKQERQVILFLASMAFLGLGVNFCRKVYSPVKKFIAFSQDIGKVSLNQADQETLKSITGIGDKLAQRIIEYRNRNGSFDSIEELKNVKGIGENKFEKLKNLFLVK
ncbi:MAG: ComEA family DNA-binding protein [Candidatus Omnitrophica bacterium]|nr:ComEA family DNA-binding protein [Candidatus Omnitrophota bacterium]